MTAVAETEPGDPDAEALTWGDEGDPSLVSSRVEPVAAREAGEPVPLSDPARSVTGSALLILYGAVAGVYALYTLGWVLAALADTTPSMSVFAQLMNEFGLFCAIAAPALWVLTVFVLTKRTAARVLGLVLGMLTLVPWPFVLGGLT